MNDMNKNTPHEAALNINGASIATLLGERDRHTKAAEAINAELTRRAQELEAAIGKPKRTRARKADTAYAIASGLNTDKGVKRGEGAAK